jgi:tetratricopeptide (TPR) repeat protein
LTPAALTRARRGNTFGQGGPRKVPEPQANRGATPDPLDAAEAALDAGRHAEALALATGLMAQGHDQPALWRLAAKAQEGLGRLDAALATAREGVARHPASAMLRVGLGKLELSLGHDAAALESFGHAIRRDPLQLEAWKGLLALRPVDPREDGLAAVAASVHDSARSARLRAKAAFVLGQIDCEAGLHDSGFDHYARANAIIAAASDPDALEYRYPPATLAFDRAVIDRHRGKVAPAPCPAILISGLPRSGKSLAEGLLAGPEVRAGDELAVLVRYARTLDWSRGADAVAAALVAAPPALPALYAAKGDGARLVSDTAPTNLFRLGLLGLMHPAVPVILCRRDPMDLGASMFFKQFRSGNLFTASLPALGRAIARAERLMAHWVDTLPNPLTVLDYETTARDPQETARRLSRLTGTAPAAVATATAPLRLSPGRSLGRAGVSAGLVGFSAPYAAQLAPMMAAYRAERDRLSR